MPRTAEEIEAELAARLAPPITAGEGREGFDGSTPSLSVDPLPRQTRYRYIHPLSEAAEGLIEYAQNPHGRFMLGLHDVDVMTRGFGRKELALFCGKAHEGKTQVMLQGIANNPDKRFLLFTPDETSELVLSKLVAMTHGVNAERLEALIKAGDQEYIDLVRRTATHDFANLIVIDESLSLGQMMEALKEAEDLWGQRCDAVGVDYLELISTSTDAGADSVEAKSQGLKRWAHDADVPLLVVHQNKKGDGERGKPMGMDGVRHGGEKEAIFMLEVFRRSQDESLEEWERQDLIDTVTVNVCKNKRPPCKKGMVDLHMNPETGRIGRLAPTITREQVQAQRVQEAEAAQRREAESFVNREMF